VLCLLSTAVGCRHSSIHPQAQRQGKASRSSGHLFVIHGDVRKVRADAVLYPTRSLSDRKWFPEGPPAAIHGAAVALFTQEHRVHPVHGTLPHEPEVWLGWVWWQGQGEPPVAWFVSAAEQFLAEAHARVQQRGCAPMCERELPLLALPVLGTGSSGAKPKTGFLLSALLLMLTRFVSENAVDVVLVTKTKRMFSAAQSVRRSLAPSQWASLEPRLLTAADRLADLARSGQLVLFLGSGTSKTNGMPGWSELLGDLAVLAGLSHREVLQLRKLALKDQAFVLQHRLGTQTLGRAVEEASSRVDGSDGAPAGGTLSGGTRTRTRAGGAGSVPLLSKEVQMVGRGELQRLAVERLTSPYYSLSHALLATLPHSATVTTNSDRSYDTACTAAGIPVCTLPYESRTPGRDAKGRWLLKLHGDVEHPEDIILTYSDGNPYGYQREALSGIVQALLITKHMLFVGFSLTDDAFNRIVATVRRALQPSAAHPATTTNVPAFGTALTLSDRPFMMELWPELRSLPMASGLSETEQDRTRRRRTLEILLDRVQLQVSDMSTHLLDRTFVGAFTVADLELKSEIEMFVTELNADSLAPQAKACDEVHAMLEALGRHA